MKNYFNKTNISILLLISIIPITFYFIHFFCNGISKNPEDWALFGDYVGGVSNLILGVCNIIITAYIAYLIGKVDKKRHKKQKELDNLRHQQSLDLQEKLFERNLKENAYKEFNILINSNKISPYETKEYLEYLYDFYFKISNYYFTNSHIFDSIKKCELERKTSEILNKLITDLDDFDQNKGIYYKDKKNMIDIFKERNKLFSDINFYFIEEMKKETH